jgi:phospho-N-acetylmuramoyl-pentapeptide-transferase
MLFHFAKNNEAWLNEHGLGFLRVFTYLTFQTVAALVLAFLIVLLFAPAVIRWLRKQKIGDITKHDAAEVDALFAGKKGTPTTGGILIVTTG